MNVLVTGGAGYIGSHTMVELLNAGHEVVCIDNFMNSKFESVRRVEHITGKKVKFYEGDIRDRAILDKIFTENKIDSVINFAGLKAVGESVAKPLEYYENNIEGLLILCFAMRDHNVKNLVFSSSATVYGKPKSVPIKEDFPLSTSNPYGSTKLFIEYMLKDLFHADPSFNIAILRYFNPVGAHESGLLGENPKGIPNNLMPYIMRVASGKLETLSVFGGDYNTVDGTGVRDYIHIMDLAEGHVSAIDHIDGSGLKIYNLGTGKGYSVLQMVDAYNKVCGGKVKYKIVDRRDGDVDECYASADKAKEELGWVAKRTLFDMCESAYKFEQSNK